MGRRGTQWDAVQFDHYRAQPSRRVYIAKADAKQSPFLETKALVYEIS